MILLLQSDKRILAGAVYGLGILLKPQALMFGPILAVAFVLDVIDHRDQWVKKLIETVLAVLAALAVLLVLSLPFQGTQKLGLADPQIRGYGGFLSLCLPSRRSISALCSAGTGRPPTR